MLKNSDALLSLLLICSPVLLLSPLVFLIGEVRKRIALRVAALAIVFGSYVILLFVLGPALLAGVIMYVADKPPHELGVLKGDRTLAGIRFPTGSNLWGYSDGAPSSLVLSKDIEINGIPAGKGTTVGFSWDDSKRAYQVGEITTGRGWTYRGVSVPPGSKIYLRKENIGQIYLPQGTGIEMNFASSPSSLPPPRPENGSGGSLATTPSKEADSIPVLGEAFLVVSSSPEERMMECVLARPLDRDGYKLAAGSLIRVFYEKGINGKLQGKVVMGTLREDCVLNGVTWPKGVRFQQLIGAGKTGTRYEVPSAVQVEDMLIQDPSTLEFDGDKLRSVLGHYIWRGEPYKSYRVDVDGEVQRVPE
jgi:hypothetical protein